MSKDTKYTTTRENIPVGKVGIIQCPHCYSEFEADTRSNENTTYTNNKPKDYDVVLGGESLISVNDVVLGGVEGIKRRLESNDDEIRIAALSEAQKYGKAGLDLIIAALQDRSPKVFQVSYSYLKNETELNVKEALQKALPLNSSVNIDYSKLRDLLIDEKWLEADKETAELLLKVRNRQKKGWLRPEGDIDKFPCQDLYTIDQLWVKLSGGKFGFSIQADIWDRLKGNSLAKNRKALESRYHNQEVEQSRQAWRNFGEAVGWRINNKWKGIEELCFNLDANRGHLPMSIVHWHFSSMAYNLYPSKPIWKLVEWLNSDEGNGRMASAYLYIIFLLNRMNQCAVDL
jgi:GUN4-like